MPTPKPTTKQDVERILAKLPEDASLEDAQYHLYALQNIERGRGDIEAGRVVTRKDRDDPRLEVSRVRTRTR